MGKTEIILTLIIFILIIFGLWFIFSGEIWYFVEYLENTRTRPSMRCSAIIHLLILPVL
jgi:hypothetical protein